MDNNYNNSYQQGQYQQQNPYGQQGQYQQNPYGQQNQYQPTNQYNPYQQPGYQYNQELEEPVSMGDWLGTLLLFSFVPCVGIILMFVWAFGSNTKKSKANFCKAYLIMVLINIGVAILIGVLFGGAIAALLGSVSYY